MQYNSTIPRRNKSTAYINRLTAFKSSTQKTKPRKLKPKKTINIPDKRSICVLDYQLFMKRLRKKYGPKIRFYQCGEYGEKKGRPHYHAIIFNHHFTDQHYEKTEHGNKLYTSKSLNEVWPYGDSYIGAVTFESAAYVARYIVDKKNGTEAQTHYQRWTPETSELVEITPEYTTMSRRPGIGNEWYKKYNKEIYAFDYVIVNGHKCTTPKYYDGLLEEQEPGKYERIKETRVDRIDKNHKDLTIDRMHTRELILKERMNRLKRTLT